MDVTLTSIIDSARAEAISRRVGTEQVLAERIVAMAGGVSAGYVRALPTKDVVLRLDARKEAIE